MAVERDVRTTAVTPDVGAKQVLSNVGVGRRTYSRIPTVLEMPNLVQIQLESFQWFVKEGLKELLEEISPITDHHRKMELYISDPRFDEPWQRMPKGETRSRISAASLPTSRVRTRRLAMPTWPIFSSPACS